MNRTGRYAPSPTGALHLGNLRTALLAWLFARSAGAPFLVRIEDLDPDRSRAEAVAGQLADLRALGIDWDDPERLLRQSERTAAYAEAVAKLGRDGLVYECYCTRREIREAASAPQLELPGGAYPGSCRELGAAERRERLRSGRPAALRVRSGAPTLKFSDRLQGAGSGAVDDFVLRRNDGTYGYNLAVVLDDALQGIGEVVRGADLLSSTPRQIWLGERLGLAPIESWAHVPLALGDDGRPLAKRHGAISLADRAAAGETPAQTLSLLAASVGLCEPGEPTEAATLLERFDPDRLPTENDTLPAPGGR